MYVCYPIRVCVYVYIVCMYVPSSAKMDAPMSPRKRKYVCMYVFMYVCMYVCVMDAHMPPCISYSHIYARRLSSSVTVQHNLVEAIYPLTNTHTHTNIDWHLTMHTNTQTYFYTARKCSTHSPRYSLINWRQHTCTHNPRYILKN
jgi:hypothetical protein